jgi:glyoxylase-like metal-dependent hydrolase (beta-lactamase superfamily II)
MIRSRNVGSAKITSVVEYFGPTHDPAFLFPELDQAELRNNADWLAPQHYVPAMNRLIVTIQLWVVHAGGNIIVVDTGIGNRKPRPAERQNMLYTLVEPWLEAAGAPRDKVTHVVHTHLHADHVGGNTRLENDRWVPTFPNAKYYMPKGDFDYFKKLYDDGDKKVNSNSWGDSVVPILDAGLAEIIDESKELAGCFTVEPAYGHTPGQVNFRLRDGGDNAVFAADVMHSPIQMACPQINTRYDIIPEVSRKTRAEFLRRSAESGCLIMPMHFGLPFCGYVRRHGDAYRLEPATWAE